MGSVQLDVASSSQSRPFDLRSSKMKYFALLMVVGLAAASSTGLGRELKFDAGKEYLFQYSGRLMSGIPELANQYSGLAINATVGLIAKSQTTLSLVVSAPKFVKINDVLNSEETVPSTYGGTNWRRMVLPEMLEVPEEFKRILAMPVLVELDGETGAIRAVKVSKSEPEWSVNYKKGIVSLFQVKMESSLSSNMIETSSEIRPFWKVMEETVSGKCLATYQANQLPEYMVKENPMLIPHPEACPEKKFYEVIRTVDFTNCEKSSTFSFIRPGHFFQGQQSEIISRSSNTRYIACGSLQTLRLKEVKAVSGSSIPMPVNPVTLKTLMFEYTEKAYGLTTGSLVSGSGSEELLKEGRIPSSQVNNGKVLAKAIPKTMFQGLNSETTPSKSEFVNEIAKILKNVMLVVRGESTEKLTETQVNMLLLTAVRGMTTLESVQEIEILYTTLVNGLNKDQSETMRQLFLDTVVMTGTPHSVEFFEKMVREGKATTHEINSFFMFLPRYIMTPTQQVLKRLFKLVTEVESIKSVPTTYSLAMTGLTQLVHSACIAEDRKTSYPVNVFGEFCTPESKIVQEVLIPHLARALHLTPMIESRGQVDLSTVEGARNSVSRVLAVYSLMNAGFQHPDLVIPILTSVFTNPAESTEMRVAAFNSLLKLNAPKHVFDTIAATTRMEPGMDMELLKVINIALYTIGHDVPMEDAPIALEMLPESLVELTTKARLAYGMVRKTYGIVPSTATFYKTEFLRALNSGYRATFAWVAAQEQILPRSGYAGLSLFLQQYYVDVAQTGFILSGTDSILDKLAEVVTKVSGSSAGTPEQLKSEIKRSIHSEMSKVIEKLGLEESIKSETLSAAGFFQGAETGIIFRSLTEKTTEIMTEKLAELLENPSKFLSGSGSSVSVNAQKSIDLAPIEIMLATDMGFPVIVEVRAPVTASLTGKATINALSMAPSVTINGKVLLATQYTGFVGTLVPFTSEYVATGIDQHSIINIPGTVEMKLDIPSQKLSIMVEPVTHEPTALAHYHILPYTTVGQINKLQPITMTPALKAIKAIPERKVLESTFGEYLGLGLKTKLVTESRFVDMRSIVEYLNIYKNPVNMLVFGWTSPALSENLVPSVRYHKMTTLLEPARTSTKALGLEIKIGAATKVEGQTGIQYHTLKKSPISGLSHEEIKEVRTNPTIMKVIKALSPLKVVSHGIESQVHERRQNNLKMVMSELESSKVSEASVTGFALTTNFILKSSRPRTFSFTLTAALGSMNEHSTKTINQEWNILLESQVPQTQVKKVAMKGHITIPILPMWNIEKLRNALINFDFKNNVIVSHVSGQESKVIVTGHTMTTEAQKTFSVESPEAKLLEELVRIQASTLDKVVFETEFVNMPKNFGIVEKTILDVITAYLWPYYTPSASTLSQPPPHGPPHLMETSSRSTVELTFAQTIPALNMKIVTPRETLVFKNIRIVYPLDLFFPLTAVKNNAVLGVSRVTSGSVLASGSAVSKMCRINANTHSLIQFNGKTIALPEKVTNGHSLMIAHDASTYRRFMVLVTPIASQNLFKTHILLKQNEIEIIPSSSSPIVTVNSKKIELPVSKEVKITGILGTNTNAIIATLLRTTDGVVVIEAPRFLLEEVATNGKQLQIIPSPLLKNKVAGLCGSFQKTLSSTGSHGATSTGSLSCVYSKPELEVASWTVPKVGSGSGSGSVSIPAPLMSELKKESQQCAKVTLNLTKVAKAYKSATGKCTLLRHLSIQRGVKMCFSKVPITQCGPSCKSQDSKMTEKTVEFTCMPAGRRADLYLKKVNQGKLIPEFKNLETSFSSQMPQPSHCVHALVSSIRGI